MGIYNIKRIIAYSTSAQMSFIFIILTILNLIGFNYSLIVISKEIILDYLLLLHFIFIKYIFLLASLISISYSIKLLHTLI